MAIDAERTGELCAILARRFPRAFPPRLARAVVAAQKAALRAKAMETRRCNVPMSEEEGERAQRSMGRSAHKVTMALAEACDIDFSDPGVPVLAVVLGGDPRGACGYLRIRGACGGWARSDGWDPESGFPLY
jgi:hypothetical protein